MLIRAVVDARLFGLRLLTLDARVVVAESDPIEPVLDAVVEVDPTVMPLARPRAQVGSRQGIRDPRQDTDRGVGHARELLAQGADTLAGLRQAADASVPRSREGKVARHRVR
jgi:hypothetical protein